MLYLVTWRAKLNSSHLCLGSILGRKEGRKEMFYLTTLSTHFILPLYGIGHMVKDHSDSEKGNPLPPHVYSFQLTARVLLYTPSHREDST